MSKNKTVEGANFDEKESIQLSKKCPKCNNSNHVSSNFCNICGSILEDKTYEPSLKQPISNEESPINTSSQALPKAANVKKNNGCFGCLTFIFLAIVFTIYFGGKSDLSEKPSSDNMPIIFDSLSFYDNSTKLPIDESVLVERLGDPDKIDYWDYSSLKGVYPVTTYIYGNYEYHFNNNYLHRISISETIPYTDKSDFLPMFNLFKSSSSVITDTNTSFRSSNCGVLDFWIQYDDNSKIITDIKISYGELFL